MARRLPAIGLVWVLAGAGCVFTSRPMIPLDENSADAGGSADSSVTGGGGDGGMRGSDTGGAFDVWVPPPSDAAVPAADAGGAADTGAVATPDAGGPQPDDCYAVEADGGDGGFQTMDGRPCDPAAVDAGEASDASADASADDVTDAHTDVPDAHGDAGADVNDAAEVTVDARGGG